MHRFAAFDLCQRVAVGVFGFFAVAPALAAVGRTPAAFDVSPAGEASYTIPIAAPPGVRGLTPQLALVYGHRSPQSIAGWGWGIAGYSVIARCASTAEQDTTPRNVRNDLQDRFCLNGNKLRLISGTYGVAGSQYRTEIETYSRITAYGSAGNGPAYFIVEGKDGLIYEFGNTELSRIESKGQPTARAWALNQIRDRDGNEINFVYFEDTANGSYRLDSVSYAGNTSQGTSAIYSIDFVYEAKPQEEIDSAYLAGSAIKETQRLDRINALVNGSTLFRRYDLTYEPALSATKRSRLASVLECAGSSPDCLAPTEFTYQDGAPLGSESNTTFAVNSTTVFPIDVNGDGRDDLVYPNGTGNWMVMFANSSGGYDPPIDTTKASTGSSGAIPIDHNSDGKMDLLVPYSSGTWWVLTIQATGAGSLADTGAPATATGANARAMDIDGDGQQDLVWIEIGGNWAGTDAIRYRRRLTSGAGFDATPTLLVADTGPDEKFFGSIFADWAQKTPRRTPDFNGDGIGDIVYSRRIRIDDPEPGVPTFEHQFLQVLCPGAPTCLSGEHEVTGSYYFGDLNGDGLSDLIYLDESASYRYRFSTGTGFTGAGTTGFGASNGSLVIFDWDSDGFDDVLAISPTTSTWYVARSNGEVLLTPVDAGFGSGSGTSAHVVTDMNGDRQPDFAYRAGAGNTWRFRAHSVTFEYPDVLESATDGFGVAATFAYKPITQSSVYTKGTGALFPVIDSQRPLWVVSTLTATDGTGNDSTYSLTFTYKAAREHLRGRGFLGFAERTVVDSRLGYNIKTIDTYKQDFPYIGALASRERKRSNGTQISLETNGWDNLSWGTAGSTERRFPFVRTRTVEERELDGTKFRTTSTAVAAGSAGIDATSGLIIDATTTTTDEVNGESKTEHIVHTPFNDTANWCLGRPADTTVTNNHTLPNGGALTRTFDATWDGANCRPSQHRVEPNNATWRVTVDLLYDAFGNVNSEKVTGAGMSARTTLTNWGTRGHFPESVTNPLNQVTRKLGTAPSGFRPPRPTRMACRRSGATTSSAAERSRRGRTAPRPPGPTVPARAAATGGCAISSRKSGRTPPMRSCARRSGTSIAGTPSAGSRSTCSTPMMRGRSPATSTRAAG